MTPTFLPAFLGLELKFGLEFGRAHIVKITHFDRSIL